MLAVGFDIGRNFAVAVWEEIPNAVTRATLFLAALPSSNPRFSQDLVDRAAEWLGELDCENTVFGYEPAVNAKGREHGRDVLRDVISAVQLRWNPEFGWQHLTTHPSSVKKAFTNNGGATKSQMLRTAELRYPQFMVQRVDRRGIHTGYSTHIADAIAIAEFAGSRSRHRRVVEGVA